MRRLSLVLVTTAAAVTAGLASAGPAAAADPLGPVRDSVTVFVTGDGDVCVTYRGTTTVCTNT